MLHDREAVNCPDCGTELSGEGWARGLCIPCLASLAVEAPSLHEEIVEADEGATLVKSDGLSPGETLASATASARSSAGAEWDRSGARST